MIRTKAEAAAVAALRNTEKPLTGEAARIAKMRQAELAKREAERAPAPEEKPEPVLIARQGSELYKLACTATRRKPRAGTFGAALCEALEEKSGIRR